MNKIESAYKEMMEDVQMSGEMIAYCMKNKALELERELTAITEQRDGLRSGIDYASDQLHKVTEQLDQFENKLRIELRGHPDSKLWGDAGLIAAIMRSVDAIDEVIDQRDRLQKIVDEQCRVSSVCREYREQRDRLAEAGKDLLKNLYNINDDGGKIATIRRMKEALQSLTTKEQ